jgi:hypothetical protein
MVLQLLAPGVQNRQKAKMGPEMPGVLRDREEGLCDRVKEEGLEALGVPQGQGIQRIGEGKHYVEIRDVEHLPLPLCEPSRLGRALTLRTVPVTAGIIATLQVPAVVTGGRMPSQRRGPAEREGAEHTLLRRRGDGSVTRQVGCPMLPHDIPYS